MDGPGELSKSPRDLLEPSEIRGLSYIPNPGRSMGAGGITGRCTIRTGYIILLGLPETVGGPIGRGVPGAAAAYIRILLTVPDGTTN